jgi:hypothetical protein
MRNGELRGVKVTKVCCVDFVCPDAPFVVVITIADVYLAVPVSQRELYGWAKEEAQKGRVRRLKV